MSNSPTQLALDLSAVTGRIQPPASSVVNSKFLTLSSGITEVLNAAIIVAGMILVLLILVGGVQYMLSLGNEESSAKARKLLINSTIGFGLVLGTWAIMHAVFGLLGYSFS